MAYDDKLVTYLGFDITAQDLNKFKEYKKLQKQAAAGFAMPAQAARHTKVYSQEEWAAKAREKLRLEKERQRRRKQLLLNKKMDAVLENYGDYDEATVAWATRRKRLHKSAMRLLDYEEKQNKKQLLANKKAKSKWQNDTRLTLASLGFFSRGFLPLWAVSSATKTAVNYGESIPGKALLNNISVEKTQQIDRFARDLGVEPDDLYSAINKYRDAKQAYKMPADKLLASMIKEIQSSNAHAVAANMHGVSPEVFKSLREYRGNLEKDLNKTAWYDLTEEEIKVLKEAKSALIGFMKVLIAVTAKLGALFVKDVKDKTMEEKIKSYERVQSGGADLEYVAKFLRSKFKPNNLQPSVELSDEENIKEHLKRYPIKPKNEILEKYKNNRNEIGLKRIEEKLKQYEQDKIEKKERSIKKDTGNITINNNFNFESFGDNTPQEISELIQSSIEEKLKNMFGDSSLTSMIGITPATVS